MLQKPDLPDDALAARLREDYALDAAEIAFLPLGADQATAVYRVVADDDRAFFLKLRSRGFDSVGVAVPRRLRDRGVEQIIPPIPTRRRRLWTRVDRFALVLYPFVDGRDGYTTPMSDRQWIELGAALRGLHAAELPPRLAGRIPRDRFDSASREAVRRSQARVESEGFDDPLAAQLASLLRGERDRVSALLLRSDELAVALRARPPAAVLCHGDMHAGNVLLGADGALHVVDWDTLVHAPREHDFEQIGGAWGGEREAELFRRGYGPVETDRTALAYYRYRRVVEDLKVVCELLLTTREGGANRAQELELVTRMLRPGQAVDLARRLDAG